VSLIEPGPILSRFRDNAYAAFQRTIDHDAQPASGDLRAHGQRLTKEARRSPSRCRPRRCWKLIHALESPRPKPRYYVTFPTT
jgi:hypothetical protein